MKNVRQLCLAFACLVLFSPYVLAEKEAIEKFLSDDGRPFLLKDLRKDYTDEIEKGYKITINKCSKCHVATRVLNTIMYDVEDWKRYVKRMMNKPDSGIAPEDGKLIYRFLKHDQKTRKEAAPQDFYVPKTIDRPEAVSWFKQENKPANW